MSKKNTFTVTIDNKKLDLKIMTISPDIRLESQSYYSRAFDEAYKNGQKLRAEAEKMLQDRNLLDMEADQAKIEGLRKDIKNLEITLRKGLTGNRRMTKDEGRDIALHIKKLRGMIGEVGSSVSSFMNNTVESSAENERLQYFIYACTVFADNGQRYWKSYEAFKGETDSTVIEAATKTFLTSLSGVDTDYEKNLYENQWLRKMGYMNDQLQLIDSKGRLIDSDGKLVNSDGRYINENGDFIDAFGNPVDEKGNLLVEDSWGLNPPTTTSTVASTEASETPLSA